MFGFSRQSRSSAALLSLTMAVSALAPIAISTPSSAQNSPRTETTPSSSPSPDAQAPTGPADAFRPAESSAS